jgi:hypothetical protein
MEVAVPRLPIALTGIDLTLLFKRLERFEVDELGHLGPWQIRERLPGSKYRIIATCPDVEVAHAIAKFLNGDAQQAYSDLKRFQMMDEEEDA